MAGGLAAGGQFDWSGGLGYGEWVATAISQCLAGDDVLAVKALAEDKFLGFFAFADGFACLDYFVELV